MGRMMTRLSGKERFAALMEAWRTAPGDADIEVRIGADQDGRPAIFISIGDDMHALMVDEAVLCLPAIDDAISLFPSAAKDEGLDNLAAAMRQAIAAAQPRDAQGEERGR